MTDLISVSTPSQQKQQVSTQTIDVIVEVPCGSRLKYEIDHDTNNEPILRLDRILATSMTYPGNYGYIPNTLAQDGDPLDALILTEYQLHPGCIINCRPVGVLLMSDEKGIDEKILVVPVTEVDPSYEYLQELSQIPQTTLDKINHFFTYYKMNDPTRWSKVDGFRDRAEAERLIQQYHTSANSS